jgi:hypothetical protein
MPPGDVTRADGKRNWPAIRAVAEQAVLALLQPAA